MNVENRRKRVEVKGNMYVALTEEAMNALANSSLLGGKINSNNSVIVRKGRGADLLKISSKRRKTMAMKDAEEQEAAAARQRLQDLEAEVNELRQLKDDKKSMLLPDSKPNGGMIVDSQHVSLARSDVDKPRRVSKESYINWLIKRTATEKESLNQLPWSKNMKSQMPQEPMKGRTALSAWIAPVCIVIVITIPILEEEQHRAQNL